MNMIKEKEKPSNCWKLTQYRDPLTDHLIGQELAPLNDLRPHLSSHNCDCIPEVETRNGMRYLTHIAFDGRPFDEANPERGH